MRMRTAAGRVGILVGANTMATASLNLVVIRSADLDRAARFYGALGIQFQREKHGSGPEHLAGNVGSVVLEIYPGSEAGDTRGVRLGFRIASLAATLVAVQEADGIVVSPAQESPWGLRAVVSDPDGRRVELVQAEVAHDPT
jgi:predicted enzyme related to lactoylglutathione lyase